MSTALTSTETTKALLNNGSCQKYDFRQIQFSDKANFRTTIIEEVNITDASGIEAILIDESSAANTIAMQDM